MADATYTPGIYFKQGQQQLVVPTGTSIKIETGGSLLPNGGSKAAKVTFTSSANMSAAQVTKLNAVCTALINLGIMATS